MNKIKMVMLVGIIGGFIGGIFTCRRLVRDIIKEESKQINKIYKVKLAVNSMYGDKNYQPDKKPFIMGHQISVRYKKDGERMLEQIQEILNDCGRISVAELYDLAQIDGSRTYLENAHGWISDTADIFKFERAGGEYALNCPEPIWCY